MASNISEAFPFALPRFLWNSYVEYLWNYEPNSWVARVASIFRILAILTALPLTVVALLDISSYLIARTLGVIDDVKASTSDAGAFHQTEGSPIIVIESSSLNSPTESTTSHGAREDSLPKAFYASEDNNLKLSDMGVFSPDISRTPSPPSEVRGESIGTLRQRTIPAATENSS